MATKTKKQKSAEPVSPLAPVTHTSYRGRRSPRFPNVHLGKTARVIGISPQFLQKVLHGTSRPSLHIAAKISQALNLTLEEIIALYKEKPEPKKNGKK